MNLFYFAAIIITGQVSIHHNKKYGGMLIVKTVLWEFALAACNDS